MSISTQAICVGASILKWVSSGQDGHVTDQLPSLCGPQKYLLVDDHAGFRDTVRDFLPGNPVELVECSDGREAADAYAKYQPDWTLMDVEMPGMDGLKATSAIRSHDPQARIIILTQHDSPEMREQARSAGAFAYVVKDRLQDLPVLLSSLLQNPPTR